MNTKENDLAEKDGSGRVDITTPRTVEEWGIRFRDEASGEVREVTFSQDYAMKYLGNEGIEVIRRERIITPDRVSAWRPVPILPPGEER